MSSHEGDGFFKGFVFGGLVGAVIALLYAPKSGKEMREDLLKTSLDLKDDAEAKLELAQKKAEALLDETKKQLEDLRKEARSAVADIKSEVDEKVADGKAAVEKGKARIKDAIGAGVAAYQKEKSTKSKRS